jgi:hypothetical protein
MYEDSLKTLGVSTQKARRPPPSIAPAFEIEAAPPKVEEKPPVEEAKAVPAKQSVAEKKAARLKRAYETGRITKGMYEDSLKKLSAVAPPEPKVAPAMEAAPEVRSAVEEAARPPPEEKLPEKVASPPEIAEPAPAAPSEDEVRAAKLKAAYESGAITKEVYKGNLTMLGLPVPSELEKEPEVAAWTPPAEVISGLKAEAAEEVLEVTPQVEEEAESPRAEEASAEGVEAAPAAVLPVSKGEAEGPGRSYRGVAIASAGGLMYVLIWLLFVPMLGNFLSFVLTALGAILIVVGYNVASNDSAAAKRARTFRCPLCSERLQMSVSECPNCGAKFIDSRQ